MSVKYSFTLASSLTVIASIVVSGVAEQVAQCTESPGDVSSCAAPGTGRPAGQDSVLLQIKRPQLVKAKVPLSRCEVDDAARCPGSGVWCYGQECCPGVDGPTFPCPSAPHTFGPGACESTVKVEDCTAIAHCKVGDAMQCPVSGDWCHGSSCCPGVDGGPSFPCPSAPRGWGSDVCQSAKKLSDCTDPNEADAHAPIENAAEECEVGDSVQCPGSGIMCHGEECCPGEEGEPNFPCPSAPRGWGEGVCQHWHKTVDCTAASRCKVGELVQCPGSDQMCRGEECCPGKEGESSFPCPSAPRGWGDGWCQRLEKVSDCTSS